MHVFDDDDTSGNWHDNAKERTRRYKKKVAQEAQDLYLNYQGIWERGPLDPKRRASCEMDPLLFGKTYFPDDFYLPFSDQHRIEAEKLKQAVIKKAWFANADRRGGGKSTRARMFVVWGIAYGHVRFPLLITATSKSAERNRDAIIKKFMYSQPLIEDFPELCLPFLFCRGKGQSANHMLWKGEPAECKAAVDRLVVPNLDCKWSQCTQSVLQFTSMQGEIRGNSHALPDGGTLRPDLAICDDPQTRQTARSKSETETLENTIKSDVAYCNGPDKKIGLIVPCTVIYKDDLADKLLDRKLNPQFHGERTQFMISFPKNMEWWERYGDLRAEMQMNDRSEEAIDNACNDLYRRERQVADEGAQVSWDYAFTEAEISAVQHGMNRWLASPSAFSAEYQNNPTNESKDDTFVLETRVVARRYSGYQKQMLPDWTQLVVASIDVSESVLWWSVNAFAMDFTASTVSYGVFPDQKRRYVTLSMVQKPMQDYWAEKLGKPIGLGAAIRLSLDTMLKTFIQTDWTTQGGRSVPCSAIMIDVGYKESRSVIYELAKLPDYKGIVHPCKGMPTSPDRPNIWNPASKPKQGERRGHHWRQVPMEDGPQTQFDPNVWKTVVGEALVTEPGDPGALTVFTTDKVSTHEMWADQMTVETADKLHSTKTDVRMTVWTCPPSADNHFFDTTVLGFVGASKLGATRVGHRDTPKVQAKSKRGRSLRDVYSRNNGDVL